MSKSIFSLKDPKEQNSSVSVLSIDNTMQAAAAPAPAAPAAAAPAPAAPPAPRHRVYTAVDPRCEWARTVEADTLVVDVSGFRKEELKVLYNTSRKLKVAGERLADDGASARWARFLKSFPVPRSVDTGAIRAVMDKDEAVLHVILPKGPPSSSTDRQKQKEQQQPASSQPRPHGEQNGGTGNAEGSSGSSSGGGSFWSAQEDAEKNRAAEEKNMVPEETKVTIQEEIVTQDAEETKVTIQEEIVTQDAPRTDGDADATAVEPDVDDDDTGKDKRWWQKIRPLHVLGFVVLILALVGVGVLCAL